MTIHAYWETLDSIEPRHQHPYLAFVPGDGVYIVRFNQHVARCFSTGREVKNIRYIADIAPEHNIEDANGDIALNKATKLDDVGGPLSDGLYLYTTGPNKWNMADYNSAAHYWSPLYNYQRPEGDIQVQKIHIPYRPHGVNPIDWYIRCG